MAAPIAVLPMYDRPELRAETDRLWAALRDALRAAGLPAPDALDRTTPAPEAWLSPRLALGQACGLPYAARLRDRVTLVGAPDYGVAGCPPGHYCSAIVVRAEDPRQRLADFAGATVAMNEPGSQSGHAALMHAAAPFARGGRFFGALRLTGAHRASAAAVAEGAADIAALDAVSWRLIRRFDACAGALRVLERTPPTPGLPLIAAAGADGAAIAAAVERGLAALDPAAREALGIAGLARFRPADYAPLAERLARAEARHRLPAPEPA